MGITFSRGQSYPSKFEIIEGHFPLEKYINGVTGETAEVRTCESILGCDRWIAAQ